jgi:hypothetical protein
MDKRVVEYYNLGEVYENYNAIENLDVVLNSGNLNLVRQQLSQLIALGFKDAIHSKIRKMREDKTLNNADVIEVVKKELELEIE